ncbi:MAG TPA: heavy metal translocating P-type ATPase metal-binding domain-containing protein [Spongiibacteraceae bacterium]|nr:heavy metal translocating P-type ATPase metal-binding domain-containing protein [Spongiibacteraceae bacterium]
MNTQPASERSGAANSALPCYHCGLPVADETHYRIVVDNVAQPLCCPGCQAVAETIIGSGLGNYYRYRENTGGRPTIATANINTKANSNEFTHFDRLDFSARWLQQLSDELVQCELSIGGIHCAACVWLLERHLMQLPGVVAVQIDFDAQRGSIRWHSPQQRLSDICNCIAAIGYQPQPYSSARSEQLQQREQRQALRRLGVAGIGMMQVGMLALGLYAGALDGIEPLYRNLLRWSSFIATVPVLLYAGQPFLSGAWRGLRARQPGMDVPVAVALLLAFAASSWAT